MLPTLISVPQGRPMLFATFLLSENDPCMLSSLFYIDTKVIQKKLKDESGKKTIHLTELEQSLSCLLTPRLTQSV